MIKYTVECSVRNFPFWSGAKDTFRDVIAAGKVAEFETLLENVFEGQTPTDGQINDFVWFDREYIFLELGIDDSEDNEEE